MTMLEWWDNGGGDDQIVEQFEQLTFVGEAMVDWFDACMELFGQPARFYICV